MATLEDLSGIGYTVTLSAEGTEGSAAVYLVQSDAVTTYVAANDDATITALADAAPPLGLDAEAAQPEQA